jgi:predicted PurR-regulated permease PerM
VIVAFAAVILYVLLIRFTSVLTGIHTFIGYFMPVILGCVIAYIISPLARFYKRVIFRNKDAKPKENAISNALAFITVIAFLVLSLMILIPQLISSVTAFTENMDKYVASFEKALASIGLSTSTLGIQNLISSSENLVDSISSFLSDNLDKILSASSSIGKNVFQWLIAILLSIYILAEKDALKGGLKRFLHACMSNDRYRTVAGFLRKSNVILNRYIVFNLLDALIVGIVNMIFMKIMGMPYAGLVSFVVGVTNLIPTFGPIFGGIMGAFILILVKPWYAVVFLIFTVVLQILDGYVLKPRMFGQSLGVSGLWILVAIIVGGNMFGIVGILLGVPAIAIIDLAYHDYLLPWLESRREENSA